MEQFTIKSYSKAELALLYFPDANSTHVAVNRLMSWIKHCTPLWEDLQRQGYRKTTKWFSPREVRLIVEHIGEP
jgi:hypothetical protein